LTNGHLENIDEKNFDEFHNVNAHIYLTAGEIDGENSTGASMSAYNDNALR